jgi:LAO/AO transport system kinase
VTPDELAAQIASGNVRAVARACRWVDDDVAEGRALLKRIYARAQSAWLIGITGSPGAGKSTLVDRLIEAFRAQNKRVGVVAVDPTSPFSGGAILGDRVRMQRHFEDPEVFIRSVATRGALGGLSRSASDIASVLAAWGAEVVLLETVGVGQDELEVTQVADTTLVVVAPGFGDDVQALKAGILECADVFVVNKADQPGADATVRDLEAMLALGDAVKAPFKSGANEADVWLPPIVRTVATTSHGITQAQAALEAHRHHLQEWGGAPRSARIRAKILALLREEVARTLSTSLSPEIDASVSRVVSGESSPYEECDALLRFLRR